MLHVCPTLLAPTLLAMTPVKIQSLLYCIKLVCMCKEATVLGLYDNEVNVILANYIQDICVHVCVIFLYSHISSFIFTSIFVSLPLSVCLFYVQSVYELLTAVYGVITCLCCDL